MEIFNELKKLVEELELDVVKFYEKGNKSAATRARKGLQDLKKLAQDLRIDIQEVKKNL